MSRQVFEGQDAAALGDGVDDSLGDGPGVKAGVRAVLRDASECGGEFGVGLALARAWRAGSVDEHASSALLL